MITLRYSQTIRITRGQVRQGIAFAAALLFLSGVACLAIAAVTYGG